MSKQNLPRPLTSRGVLYALSKRVSGEENGNPLQYSSLGNSTDRGIWWAIVHRAAKSQTQLSDWTTIIRDSNSDHVVISNSVMGHFT